jgi:hypothetical protein
MVSISASVLGIFGIALDVRDSCRRVENSRTATNVTKMQPQLLGCSAKWPWTCMHTLRWRSVCSLQVFDRCAPDAGRRAEGGGDAYRTYLHGAVLQASSSQPHAHVKRSRDPAASHTPQKWVQCAKCSKWRKVRSVQDSLVDDANPGNAPQVPFNITDEDLPDDWQCRSNRWDPSFSVCSVPQELSNKEIDDILAQQVITSAYRSGPELHHVLLHLPARGNGGSVTDGCSLSAVRIRQHALWSAAAKCQQPPCTLAERRCGTPAGMPVASTDCTTGRGRCSCGCATYSSASGQAQARRVGNCMCWCGCVQAQQQVQQEQPPPPEVAMVEEEEEEEEEEEGYEEGEG